MCVVVSGQDEFDQIPYLTGSRSRVELLGYLVESGPATRREIREHLETSQTTVNRTVETMLDRNWILERDGEFEPTPLGTLVSSTFQDWLTSMRSADALAPFLRWFPDDEFDLDISRLVGAEVVPYIASDPYVPARRQTELLREIDRFRGFLPSTDLEGTRVIHERITSGGLEATVVVSRGVGEVIRTDDYRTLYADMMQTGRLTVRVFPGELPFYLGLTRDELVQVGVEDDAGIPRALVDTTDEAVRDWAESVYDEYVEDARGLGGDDF